MLSAFTFLDVVIRQSPSVLQLLAGENETLLVRGNPWKNGKNENEWRNGQLWDLETSGKEGMELFEKWKAIITFLVLNLGFHILDGVRRFDLERDGLPGQSFHENLHGWRSTTHTHKCDFFPFKDWWNKNNRNLFLSKKNQQCTKNFEVNMSGSTSAQI